MPEEKPLLCPKCFPVPLREKERAEDRLKNVPDLTFLNPAIRIGMYQFGVCIFWALRHIISAFYGGQGDKLSALPQKKCWSTNLGIKQVQAMTWLRQAFTKANFNFCVN